MNGTQSFHLEGGNHIAGEGDILTATIDGTKHWWKATVVAPPYFLCIKWVGFEPLWRQLLRLLYQKPSDTTEIPYQKPA